MLGIRGRVYFTYTFITQAIINDVANLEFVNELQKNSFLLSSDLIKFETKIVEGCLSCVGNQILLMKHFFCIHHVLLKHLWCVSIVLLV